MKQQQYKTNIENEYLNTQELILIKELKGLNKDKDYSLTIDEESLI